MKKSDKLLKDENKEESNLNETTLNDFYSKYIIEDLDFLSQSSNDDIDTKMNKMINKIKKRGNINNILSDSINIKEDSISKTIQDNDNKDKLNKKQLDLLKEETNNISSINNTIVYKKRDSLEEEKKNRISSKKKKLELLKQKEERYLNIL